MAPRVLINETIAQSGIDLLGEHFETTVTPGWDSDELAGRLGEFDGVVIRSATKLTADLIEAGSRLKVIGRAGVGVDNVDLDAASRRGIIVVNAPFSTVATVAEHTIALMFAMARTVAQGDATMKAGQWARSALGKQGVELHGKTLSLLGFGRIGQQVASRARALGMRVTAYDPFVSPERFAELGIDHADTLEEALGSGDFISVHMPLTDDTRNLVDRSSLNQVRPGARLVNTARGGLVDLDALHAALESGQLAGAALDVYPTEPPPAHPVFSLPQVVLTPHLAASTSEAQDRAGVAVAEQVTAALTGGVVTTAVNVPAIAAEDVEALQPFVPLASGLARLAWDLAGSRATTLTVEARGALADHDVRMLGSAALVGVFAGRTEDPVTFVNCTSVARERGVELVERKDREAADFQNLVTVTVSAGDHGVCVAGTTIGAEHRPWLTSIDGFNLEIELTEHMAIMRYDDVPGMIGRIGTAFGNARINIANMAVSRRDGKAMMALSFDSQPDQALIGALDGASGFDWARSVSGG